MTAVTQRVFVMAEPITLDRRKKSKPGKSKAEAEVARIEKHANRAVSRSIKATGKGARSYAKARKKSGKKKAGVDSALDTIPAFIEASAIAARQMAMVPADLAGAMTDKRSRRSMQRGARALAKSVSRSLLI